MAVVKAYLKRVVAYLKEKGKEDRVPEFQKGATEMIKFIVSKYDEMMIFTGESYDAEAGLAFSYTKDGETEPTFLFFLDGTKEQKFWRIKQDINENAKILMQLCVFIEIIKCHNISFID